MLIAYGLYSDKMYTMLIEITDEYLIRKRYRDKGKVIFDNILCDIEGVKQYLDEYKVI